jgi:hypothetical protein
MVNYMNNYKAYLRKQPTYDEITGYIHFGQDRITYPDRSATILRDSPYLGIYDGMGMQELEEQEQQIEREKLKEVKAREIAREGKKTHVPPEPGTIEDPPLPPRPVPGEKGGGKGIKGRFAPRLGQPVPISQREDQPLATDVDSDVDMWQEAKEYADADIEGRTEQNELKIKRKVQEGMLSQVGNAIKNTAGGLYNIMPNADQVADGAELGWEVTKASVMAGVAVLKGTAWTINALIDVIDAVKGNGSSIEEGGYEGGSYDGTYGGGSRPISSRATRSGATSSGATSSGATSSGGVRSRSRSSGGAVKAKADLEVDKAFIQDFSKKKPSTLTSLIMKDPLMIEIVHNLNKDEQHDVEERLHTFQPKQLANVLAHLRAGLTSGIEVM